MQIDKKGLRPQIAEEISANRQIVRNLTKLLGRAVQ